MSPTTGTLVDSGEANWLTALVAAVVKLPDLESDHWNVVTNWLTALVAAVVKLPDLESDHWNVVTNWLTALVAAVEAARP